MKSLNMLIRLRRRVLDEKRRALGSLEAQADRLTEARAALAKEQQREADLINQRGDSGFGFGNYLTGVRRRDDAYQHELEGLADQIAVARDEVAEAFSEIKRFELIEAAQAERARKEALRREQQELDELGLDMFRRGGSSSRRP